MALIDTTVAALRRRLSAPALAQLCEAYGLHPQYEDGSTELRLTLKELTDLGWRPASKALADELPMAA
ncbi:hypothetical protein [Methylibium petroleiphilum]|uniref:Uncharacterized protein n=1 Tax=Methylibium petroleiphilum (strain ATCC BAA-1232 / LMG 22953 / PM1) TaxID=420662 RepID=A2SN95_METPP|nr:hypothetical protein [Methylibium petroleiphilum]ABM97034.1 hypothetical protein Mpe_B0259 [Methylibium petroleiphilum PM1]